jgi:hypothetical protein
MIIALTSSSSRPPQRAPLVVLPPLLVLSAMSSDSLIILQLGSVSVPSPPTERMVIIGPAVGILYLVSLRGFEAAGSMDGGVSVHQEGT